MARRFLVVVVVALLGVVLVPQAFAAGAFQVNVATDTTNPDSSCAPGNDPGSQPCSLRDAIAHVNETDGGGTITFASALAQQTITLGAELDVSRPAVIDGSIAPSKVGVTIAAGETSQGLVLLAGSDGQTGSNGSNISGLAFVGFKADGVGTAITVDSDESTVEGNWIGVASDGSLDAGGADTGILVEGADNTIGSSVAGRGNVIVDSGTAVDIDGSGFLEITDASENTVIGNLIGLQPDGSPGPSNGVGLEIDNAPGTIVGSDVDPGGLAAVDPARANAIAGSTDWAIEVSGSSSTGEIIAGNLLGADAGGDETAGNEGGIHVLGSSNNQLGPGNVIAHSEGEGIRIEGDGETSANGNRVVANSIYANGQGIVLGDEGNDGLGAPTVTGVSDGFVSGSITAPAGLSYFIEIFVNPSCAGTANGAGKTYVIFANASIPGEIGSGDGTATWSTPVGGLVAGEGVTATATDTTSNDTSPFSNCFTAEGAAAGSLEGSVSNTPAGHVNLTAAGTADWAGWGSGDSTALTPSVRKAGGSGISALSQSPGDGVPRNFGQYQFPLVPFGFDWADGSPTAIGNGASLGITAPAVGQGFTFTVPADVTPRTLKVWTSAHYADGHFTATLSDDSAPPFTYTLHAIAGQFTGNGENVPAVFTIDYAAAHTGAHLTVSWVQGTNNSCPNCDDIVIYAAALSGGAGATGATATLTSDASVGMSGSNDSLAAIPLRAFDTNMGGNSAAPINGLPLNGLPLNGLPLNGLPLNGLPLNGLPINGLPLNGLPLNGLPLNGLPINGLPLNGLPLNGLPLNGLSWQTLLAGTPLANKPLQTITLQDVLALNPKPAAIQNLTLGQLDLSGSALGQETLGALALGSAPLNGLGLPADAIQSLVDWCKSVVATNPLTACTTTALGGYSLFALGLAGAPLNGLPLNALPLNGLTVNGLPLNGLPLNGLPLNGLPLNGLQLSASPLNGLPLNGLPLNGLVTCTPGVSGCVTLGDAAAANALKANATVLDLLKVLLDPNSSVKSTVTLGDILGLLIKRNDVPWETLSPRLLSAFDPGRPQVTMTATATVQGPEGGQAPATVTVQLPDGFDYVPGSTTGGTTIDPSVNTDTNTLTWQVSATFNTPVTFQFKAWSGTDVGATQASVTATSGNTTSQIAAAPITVTDSFPGNNTTGNAPTIAADQNVQMSALPSAGAVDFYKITLPPAGTRLQIHLTNLHADYDLALYSAQSTTVRTGAPAGPPLQDGTVADQTLNLQGGQNQQLTPTALQDIPDPGIPVVQVSANRGTDDEDVGMVSPGSGVAYVAVFGYNGASSPQPYTLRVKTLASPQLNCPPRTVSGGTAGTAPAISSLPANLNTLILVNTQRIGATYGTGAETNVRNALNRLVGDTSLGVSGAVIPVEGLANAQAQYHSWDLNPCNVDAANAVANTIANYVLAAKQARPSLKYVVFAGGDDQIPFFRIPDLSLIANEAGFAGQFGQNEYFGALAAGDLLTDSPYLDTRPIPASGRQLFIPDLAGGRLVETSTEIINAVSRFETSSGKLAASTGFVSGYDFVTDGSQRVQQRLNTVLTGGTRSLISDNWSKANLLSAAFPSGGPASVNDWNGHYDDHQALAANGDRTNLITTADLVGSHALNGGIFFTMGCHAGFQATDVIVGATASDALDWAQKFAQTGTGFVGNTGFGIGNTDSVAFAEELMAGFAGHLDGSLSIGDALLQAKQDYFLSRDAFSSYDEKTLAEAELYGLPMYGVNRSPTALAALTSTPDPVTGATSSTSPSVGTPGTLGTLDTRSFDVAPNFGSAVNGARGTYYTNGGQVQAPNYRPLQPYVTMPANVTGLTAHGVIVDGLTSSDDNSNHGFGTNGFNPDNVRPTVDLSTKEPEPQFGDEAWPSKIPTLVSLDTAAGVEQRLNLATGQFFTDTGGATPQGVERKWTHISGRVVYSTSSDFTPPTVDQIDSFIVGGNVTFTGRFSDLDQSGNAGTVKFVQVVYDVDNTGTWKSVQLQLDTSTGQWSGGAPFTGTNVQFFVMACDAAGNCGYSSNKGRYFDAQPLPTQTGGLTLAKTGTTGAGGWFTGSVNVTGQSDTGAAITVSIDGGDFHALPAAGVSVTGDGTHVIDAEGSDGSSATTVVLIDATKPDITIDVPATVGWGTSVPINFTCLDRGSGATSCSGKLNGNAVATGALLPTSGLIGTTFTIDVDSADAAGNTNHKTQTVTIVKAMPTITWSAPAPILYGTKLSATQLNATANTAGTFTYTPPTGTLLQPGTQTLTASFAPSDTAHFVPVTTTRTVSVGFTGGTCQTGARSGSLVVATGTAYCIDGGSVSGSISVQSGAALWINNAKLSGSISVSGANAFTMCKTSQSGAISITGTKGYVLIGGLAATGCAGNTVSGSVSITKNTGGLSFVGNKVSGSGSITNNTGGFTYSGNTFSGAVVVSGNS